MSKKVILFGKTTNNKQRYKCVKCNKAFIWKSKLNKLFNEKRWFDLWVKESYSIRQLSKISGHSKSKLERIKNRWLNKLPIESKNLTKHKYIIYDGTYFHKNGCLMSLMDTKTQNIISTIYAKKEGYKTTYPWFMRLKAGGLNPRYIVMDGEQSVIRSIKLVWPNATIQRCLYHIQREGMRWLRTYPKTQAGRELRYLLKGLCAIRSIKERDAFISNYKNWLSKHIEFIKSLPTNIIAFKDLKRTIVLINNALPDMFNYLQTSSIPATTNALEGFYSRLKADYRRHRGLTQKSKINYLKWYCFLKNNNNL
ncbi:transposase [Candidatus Omnitrophota bacterium]